MKKRTFLLSALLLALGASSAYAHKDGKTKWFDRIDVNGDDVITEDEFLEFRKKRFTQMDVNNDGKVTRDEAKTFRKQKRESRGHND